MVQAYFNEIATLLSASAWVKSVRLIRYDLLDIEEERILIYRIRVGLFDGGLLEISERLVSSLIGGTITITMYRLHWQDRNGGLIKRWDNAPHHPQLETHPHHVHIGTEDHIMPSHYVSAKETIGLIDKRLAAVN